MFKIPSSKFKIPSSKFKVQSSKFKIQSSKKKNRLPCLDDRSSLQEKYIEIGKY